VRCCSSCSTASIRSTHSTSTGKAMCRRTSALARVARGVTCDKDCSFQRAQPREISSARIHCPCLSAALRSLNAFVVVFARGLDLAPGGRKKQEAVTLRELQKRVSGNAQDYDEVIRKAKRQSSTGGAPPIGSVPPSVPGSKRGSATGCPVPSTPGTPGRPTWHPAWFSSLCACSAMQVAGWSPGHAHAGHLSQ
jgi:hypothetical protein